MSALQPVGSASWLSLPRVLVPIAAAVALVVLIGAAAIWAGRGTQDALAGVQADLSATRDVLSSHAAAMSAQGQRLLRVTESSRSPHREHWVSDAQRMIADAVRLADTARMIGNQAALLGQHPGQQAVRTDLDFVRSTGEGLVAEGDRLVTHGQAMREHGLAMEELARASEVDIPPADAASLRESGEQLVDAGQRTRTAGVLLRSVGENRMRGLGR